MTTTVAHPARLNTLTTEYLRCDVSVPKGTTIETLNSLPVSFAFLTSRDARPVTGDWKAGGWDIGTAVAKVLVGPDGGVTMLTAGIWFAWCKISGSVEKPVRPVGVVRVE